MKRLLQNVQCRLWYIASLFCNMGSTSLNISFYRWYSWLEPRFYFMFILFSCACHRIFGVIQPVAFFAASAENMSFILHGHNIIRAFVTGLVQPEVAVQGDALGRALRVQRGREALGLQAGPECAEPAPSAEAPSHAPENALEMPISLGVNIWFLSR